MKFAKYLLFALLLLAAFFVGQFTAKPATFALDADGSSSEIDQAWHNFIRAQQETLALLKSQAIYADEQSKWYTR